MEGGLGRLFARIIPLVTLICFICFGITYAIATPEGVHLTYLTEEYYDTNTYEQIYNPTEEQKQNADKIYNFDMVSYVKNIDIDILSRAITNVIDLQAYTDNANSIKELWKDGYQIGDVTKTILNVIVLVLNTIILTINAILFPVRIACGIILTALSLIGININQGIILIPFLKFILDKFAIPFVDRIGNEDEYIDPTFDLYQTTWYIDSAPIVNTNIGVIYDQLTVTFTTTNQYGNDMEFVGIRCYKEGTFIRKNVVAYISATGNEYVVYKGGWKYESMRTITIEQNYLSQEQDNALRTFLATHCTQIT